MKLEEQPTTWLLMVVKEEFNSSRILILFHFCKKLELISVLQELQLQMASLNYSQTFWEPFFLLVFSLFSQEVKEEQDLVVDKTQCKWENLRLESTWNQTQKLTLKVLLELMRLRKNLLKLLTS